MADSPRKSVRKTGGKSFTAVERQVRALELRKTGMSYREIADEVGYASASGAQKSVITALQKMIQEPANELRNLELERLDVMLASLWPAILAKGPYTPRNVEVALKIMDRRAALLGLDAPVKHEDTQRIEVTMLIKRIAEEAGLDEGDIIKEAERILQETAV